MKKIFFTTTAIALLFVSPVFGESSAGKQQGDASPQDDTGSWNAGMVTPSAKTTPTNQERKHGLPNAQGISSEDETGTWNAGVVKPGSKSTPTQHEKKNGLPNQNGMSPEDETGTWDAGTHH